MNLSVEDIEKIIYAVDDIGDSYIFYTLEKDGLLDDYKLVNPNREFYRGLCNSKSLTLGDYKSVIMKSNYGSFSSDRVVAEAFARCLEESNMVNTIITVTPSDICYAIDISKLIGDIYKYVTDFNVAISDDALITLNRFCVSIVLSEKEFYIKFNNCTIEIL